MHSSWMLILSASLKTEALVRTEGMLWVVWSFHSSINPGCQLVGVHDLILSNWSWQGCQSISSHYCYVSMGVAFFFSPASVGNPGLTSYSGSNGEVALRRVTMIKSEACCDCRAGPGLGWGEWGAQGTKPKEASVLGSCKSSTSSWEPR